ncbi:hypothetical protein MPF19_02000 [Polaribacter sp. Z014]|uniref:hypothetical protein n=1 Tax=unclassified Polaribacter TaxID=196858 RepID=UPI00193BE136|nr:MULTISPECIES: hypothetical protein [unclassified Polaribacter]MCL7762171.1 hypothetical protein [Polaribacter sp. Z014]QVY64402.1 hypothetical protein JOP69_11545 [Polaribacter sp. Q13]
MKSIKLLLTIIITSALFSSCSTVYHDSYEDNYQNQVSLEQVVTDYDLWYVDYNRKTGTGDIPYVASAFTLSFVNGILYANNNIVDIGRTGNGFGIDVGTYNTYNGELETNHDIDGANDFEVTVLSNNEIKLYNYRQNVSYYLIGYQVNEFDYDKLFYENIEYFLQEYIGWEKVSTKGGVPNAFDSENYLAFKPEDITTFYSSQEEVGTKVDYNIWDFVGGYEISDINGFEDIKDLTLFYDGGDTEEFKLSVINDGRIALYNYKSGTTYEFSGRGYLVLKKSENSKTSAKDIVRNDGRKRTKVIRKIKERRNLK